MSWNETKIQQLCEMWSSGLSAQAIANKLGFSRNAIIGKANRLKKLGQIDLHKPSTKGAAAKNVNAKSAVAKQVKPQETKIIKTAVQPTIVPRSPAVLSSVAAPVQNATKTMLRPTAKMAAPPVTTANVALKRASKSALSEQIKPVAQQCRWPLGDPRSPDFKFCTCTALETLPYCLDHARIAYQNFGRGRNKRDDNTQNVTGHVSANAG